MGVTTEGHGPVAVVPILLPAKSSRNQKTVRSKPSGLEFSSLSPTNSCIKRNGLLFFWFGLELANRTAGGESPLLSDAEVRQQNSTTGVNLVPWAMGLRVQDRYRPELTQDSLGAFIRETGAFRIKEAIFKHQYRKTSKPLYEWRGSPRLEERCVGASLEELQSITAKPQLMYLTRDLARARVGSWTTYRYFSWWPDMEEPFPEPWIKHT